MTKEELTAKLAEIATSSVTAAGKIRAPWDEMTVMLLNAGQQFGDQHPYTCSNGCEVPIFGGSLRLSLIAGVDGWFCPGCAYRQDWAHAFGLTIVADRLLKVTHR